MLTETIQEKMVGWNRELSEIRERINSLNGVKREAQASVQAALKGRNAEELVSARAELARVNEEIEALKLIEAEIAKVPPVDRDLFQAEYAEFYAQQQKVLDETYCKITVGLAELETTYNNYEQAYQRYLSLLQSWQTLAAKIGADRPAELRSQVLNPIHSDIKRAITRLRSTGGF